jgi:hypothetical protein
MLPKKGWRRIAKKQVDVLRTPAEAWSSLLKAEKNLNFPVRQEITASAVSSQELKNDG